MANRLGFSHGKGFLKKVDLAVQAEKTQTTDFTNAEWKPYDFEAEAENRSFFYEGKTYELQFSYGDETWVFTFSVPACTTDTIRVGYLESYVTQIHIALMGRRDNGARRIEGSIGEGGYSLADNVTNGKYREIN